MGREFLSLFDHWADSYDDTVSGHDEQYEEVFRRYSVILKEIVHRAGQHVLEFGSGTGNLTAALLAADKNVFGVEPSDAMKKAALQPSAIQPLPPRGRFHCLLEERHQFFSPGFAGSLRRAVVQRQPLSRLLEDSPAL